MRHPPVPFSNQKPPWYTVRVMLVAYAFLLAGCHDPHDAGDVLDRYGERLARVLEEHFEPPQPVFDDLALPRRRTRTVATRELRIDMLEALDLIDCDLLHLVGARNSSLGRLQRPSQRLVYEQQMVSGLRRCLEAPPNPGAAAPEFRQWLRELVAIKEQHLQAALWNTVYGDAEIERLFSLSGPLRDLRALEQVEASTQSLREMAHLLRQIRSGEAPDNARVEAHLDALQRTQGGAVVLAQLRIAGDWLEALTALLERGEPRRMCPGGVATRRARILHNVFRMFYVGEVQPWLARLQAAASDWLDALAGVHLALPGRPPPGLQAYRQHVLDRSAPGGPWQRFRRAVPAHARAWQRWLSACGLMPQRPAGTPENGEISGISPRTPPKTPALHAGLS